MDERIGTSRKKQRNFFQSIKAVSGLRWLELARLCNVSDRTLRDWARGRYTSPYVISNLLSVRFSVALPEISRILKPYWYVKKSSRLGGLARHKKHGLLGDSETRSRGGINSQARRRKDPEKYRLLGCNVAKQISVPSFSKELAELCGILLGDGGMTDSQIRITLNKKTDANYGKFVARLLAKIFKEKPAVGFYRNVITLTLSGVNLVKAMEKIGLQRGNKVAHQVSIPKWILQNKEFAKACVRGLIDTDGGVYFHRHISGGRRYMHFGLTFTNHSKRLIQGLQNILEKNNFVPSTNNPKKIYIYKLREVERYFNVIGSHNPKHTERLNAYLKYRKK